MAEVCRVVIADIYSKTCTWRIRRIWSLCSRDQLKGWNSIREEVCLIALCCSTSCFWKYRNNELEIVSRKKKKQSIYKWVSSRLLMSVHRTGQITTLHHCISVQIEFKIQLLTEAQAWSRSAGLHKLWLMWDLDFSLQRVAIDRVHETGFMGLSIWSHKTQVGPSLSQQLFLLVSL